MQIVLEALVVWMITLSLLDQSSNFFVSIKTCLLTVLISESFTRDPDLEALGNVYILMRFPRRFRWYRDDCEKHRISMFPFKSRRVLKL